MGVDSDPWTRADLPDITTRDAGCSGEEWSVSPKLCRDLSTSAAKMRLPKPPPTRSRTHWPRILEIPWVKLLGTSTLIGAALLGAPSRAHYYICISVDDSGYNYILRRWGLSFGSFCTQFSPWEEYVSWLPFSCCSLYSDLGLVPAYAPWCNNYSDHKMYFHLSMYGNWCILLGWMDVCDSSSTLGLSQM